MHKSISFLPILLVAIFSIPPESAAQYVINEGGEEGSAKSRTIVLPYAFSSETLGFGVGLAGTYASESQPQSLYYSTAYATDNGSWLVLLGGRNLQFPAMQRLYVRPYAIFTQQTQMRIYVDGNPSYPNERTGSNKSSEFNYIEEDAKETTADLELKYVLPIGHYRDTAVHTYVTRNGILMDNPSGATSINPLQSGKSTVFFRPYYRKVFTEVDKLETLYFEFAFEHKNTDFIPNPHRGYDWKIGIQHDPDWLKNTRRWTSFNGQIDGFIPLWNTSWSRQQTLALAGWSAYSPSYDTTSPGNDGKPPYFTGPTLGGLWRLRGYPSGRFHDKAAIYYGAEYRVMPEWQPLGNIGVLDPLKIRWWQVVALAEAGRVAPRWNFQALHSDMKYSFGAGIRGMFESGIGRLDFTFSDEGFSIVAMFGQAF